LRRRVRAGYDAVLATHDLLLLPTVPMKATPIPGKDATPQEITQRSWEPTRNTCLFNVTGHPAISVPCGMEDSRPIGLMLVGRPSAPPPPSSARATGRHSDRDSRRVDVGLPRGASVAFCADRCLNPDIAGSHRDVVSLMLNRRRTLQTGVATLLSAAAPLAAFA